MSGGFEWVEDDRTLRGVVTGIGRGPLALDTEADSFHHYREQVCLVQLAFDGRVVLIDPLAGADVRLLAGILGERSVRKILHGADYDLRILHRDFGLTVRGVFDTMIAARLAGERSLGLAALLERFEGVQVDKSHQRADWTRRPLPDDLKRYAAEDTRFLRSLSMKLEHRLRQQGRLEWAAEEFERLESLRWTRAGNERDAYRSLKGVAALDRRGLQVLRALHGWRDGRARELDLPPPRIATDRVLVALAQRRPSSPRELSRMPRLPGALRRSDGVREVLVEIERALSAPSERWPERTRTSRARTEIEDPALFERLRRRRDELAEELDLDPSVLASRAVLEAVVSRAARGESWREHPDLRRWQAAWLAQCLEQG